MKITINELATDKLEIIFENIYVSNYSDFIELLKAINMITN